MQERLDTRRFRRLWTAVGLSSIGDGMVLVGFPLLVLEFTRSPILVAGVAMAAQLPALFAALPAGALADRLNRRRFILLLEVSRLAILTAFSVIVLVGWADLPVIYVTAFIVGTLGIAFDVVAGAALPSVVPNDKLVWANARLVNVEQTSEGLLGEAVGGAAFGLARSIPFFADAASFVASAALLRGAVPDEEPAPSESSTWDDLREGLKWFRSNPLLRLLTSLIGSLAFCQGIVMAELALFARTLLHLSPAGYGLLLAVAAIGNFVGTVLAPRVAVRLGSGATIVVASVVAAVAYPVLAITRSALVAGGVLLIECAAVFVGKVPARALRQGSVPPDMQGRASSAYLVTVLSCAPLGALAGGILGDLFGLRPTFAVAGGLQLIVIMIVGRRLLARLPGDTAGDGSPTDSGATELALEPPPPTLDRDAAPPQVIELVDPTGEVRGPGGPSAASPDVVQPTEGAPHSVA